ncbi:ankyrin repeat domain-containing protein 54 [Octopus sinensis]|uniref:Ankyrin repeat domain-containing protein 54 n=1 Tax=Octopus sinensis TaxID=2607531 RepID=A0A6P7T9Z1_9MOLL|nr:ankyrin repeat domain-containing protein 54 [Octopus sinensis]
MNIDKDQNQNPDSTRNIQGSGDTPKFDVSIWPEKIPGNLHYTSDYVQNKLLGKVKPSTSHRQVRLKDFKVGIRRNPKDERKMMSAANKNDYPSVLKFLESGIDARSADEKKRTALHFAAAQGNVLIAQMLIERGADPNQIDILNNTPLHLAVCTNNIAMVTLLLKAGTNAKAIQQCGRRLLLLAKSTLCTIPKNTDFNCEKHKQDALQLTEMLLQYLCRTGWESDVKQLEYLRNLLHKPSCNDLDNVSELLSEFTRMAIDRPIT